MGTVPTEVRNQVLWVRLNRPEARNAFDEAVIEGLHAAMAAAKKDRSLRAVVLAGEGKAFCAGADVEWMRRQGEASRSENEASALRLAELFDAIDSLDVPVVARVQGAAIGGGVGLAAASDVVMAAEGAVFALSEARLGLIPAVIGPFVLRKIGLSHTRELFLTARRFDAAEALRIGLVHRVAPEARLDAVVDEAVRDLQLGGPEALARIKRYLRELPAMLEGKRALLAKRTAWEIADVRAGDEAKAGARAFLEKKPPPWVEGSGAGGLP